MKVLVYVEGPSDKLAMLELLRPLIQRKSTEGVAVLFFDAPKGDKKKSVLLKVPRRAANIILNDPHSTVVAMPDLYPRNKGFPHETFDQLRKGILRNFREALRNKSADEDPRLEERFQVFCFKHDLEALILASEEALKSRLGARSLDRSWRVPVEDQNHDLPPKRIVEDLFQKHGQLYKNTVDAPLIMAASAYDRIADACPQCFKPFVKFLESVRQTGS